MQRLPQILICDDDTTFHLAIKYALKGKYDCRSAYNGDEALAILRNHPIDVILLDVSMRTEDEGLKYIPQFKELDDAISIIMTSGNTGFETVRDAMKLGATDYVAKDFNPDDLSHTIQLVLDRRSLVKRKDQQNFEAVSTQKKHTLVGCSKAIQDLRKIIERIRSSPANVVIHGETGTGKEVVARQLRGVLVDGTLAPFVAVDSSTIQSTMAESLLFGHEKGAFTGADRAVKGIFEEANGGVVYFDEVANMPLQIQAKLLRVLQEKEVTRLGSSKTIPLEFRVICATNRRLEEMIQQGEFKDDLYQRLNVIPIHIPPLRERKDDIPELVAHFCATSTGKSRLNFTAEAIQVLQNYSWPGNVRELGNLVAYVAAMNDGLEIDVADLPPLVRDAARPSKPQASNGKEDSSVQNFYAKVAEFERAMLSEAYAKFNGNVSKMALGMGMDRSHLYTKLKEYGLHLKK